MRVRVSLLSKISTMRGVVDVLLQLSSLSGVPMSLTAALAKHDSNEKCFQIAERICTIEQELMDLRWSPLECRRKEIDAAAIGELREGNTCSTRTYQLLLRRAEILAHGFVTTQELDILKMFQNSSSVSLSDA